MFKDIDKTIIYYGVYGTDSEEINQADILCTARKKFFESSCIPQKARGNVKTSLGLNNYSYVIEIGVSLRYRMITKDGKQLARVFDTAGGYFAETLDYFHRPLKRAYFNKLHKWLKTEFISPNDRTIKYTVYPSRDGEIPVIILKENNFETVLYAFTAEMDNTTSAHLNKLTGTPRIFCSTSFGNFYFCTKQNYTERKKALEEVINPTYFSTEVYASWTSDDEPKTHHPAPPPQPEIKKELPVITEPPAIPEPPQTPAPYERKCVFSGECPYETAEKLLIESNGQKFFYFGELSDNKRHGIGKTVMPNGQTAYEGNYQNNQRHGMGVHYYKSGKLCYAGNWHNNQKSDLGVAFSPDDNSAFIGQWRNGDSVGIGAFFDCKGNLLYLGNAENGVKNGAGITYNYDNKAFFVGKYENGKFLDSGTLFDSKGNLLYTGGYKNNQKNGVGTSYHVNGSVIYQGHWLNDMYDGEGVLRTSNGCTLKGSFKLGKADGPCILSDKNGKIIYNGNFENDLYNGKGRLFLENGNYADGQFLNGQPTGIFKEYNSNDHLVYSGEWADMHRCGIGTEYKHGDKIYEGEFKNSLYSGKGIQLFNGNIIYKGSFLNGMRDGYGVELWNNQTYYQGMWKGDVYNGSGILFENSKPRYVGIFKDGKMHGRINEISDNKIIRKSIYENGILIYTCDYDQNGSVTYYGSIADGLRNGMGCTFAPSHEKNFEGIFRSDSPSKPMKIIFRELEDIPPCPELQNTPYETFRKSPEFAIEKNISVANTSGIFTGSMKNKLPDGEGTILYSDHRYTGSFSNGVPNGHGIIYMSDGSTKKGSFSLKPFEEFSQLKFHDITYYFKDEVSE